MNILIVSDVYRPGVGGVQTAIDTLIAGLVAAGDTVTVLTGSPKGLVKPYDEHEGPVTVIRLPAVKWPLNPDNNRVCFFPRRHVRRYFASHEAPDVIHMHTPASWLHEAVASEVKARGIPYVVTNHTLADNMTMNMKFAWLFAPIVHYLQWRTLRFVNSAAAMTAPTQPALEATPGVTIKTLAISNGLDTDTYSPGPASRGIRARFGLDDTKQLIIYTGRLDGEKRIDVLIDAMGHLCDIRDDVQLVIVGKGLLARQLQEQAEFLGAHCAFTGYVSDDDKRALLRESTLFVMPSPAELQCISALEAMACGVPIVVADRVALPALIDGGKNGVTFHYPDAQDLAHQMAQLLNEPKKVAAMRKHTRVWTKAHHSSTQTVAQYRHLYQSVKGRPSHSETAAS